MKCECETKKGCDLEENAQMNIQIEFEQDEIYIAIPLLVDGKIKYEGDKINFLIPVLRNE